MGDRPVPRQNGPALRLKEVMQPLFDSAYQVTQRETEKDTEKPIHKGRLLGQHFTTETPFDHPAFSRWANLAQIGDSVVLEPFAGANHLITHLEDMGMCQKSVSYDIEPAHERVQEQDTLASFPEGYSVCVTNPPWLARNSATFRGIPFPDCKYDDLYKFALEKCLVNCDWVAALVPESFIRAKLFRYRLMDFISMPETSLFEETGHPVGMALFHPHHSQDVNVWSGTQYLGKLPELEALRPKPKKGGPEVRFNDPEGNVGLIALDNAKSASIRFCSPAELGDYVVKRTNRHITKLWVDGPVRINAWNAFLRAFRDSTYDVLMTCYKGRRCDGKYRRRLDWELARGIIHHCRK